ncbi:MAG TPA: hypothetical protein VF974_06570 [Patescibacteria group bacterium]
MINIGRQVIAGWAIIQMLKINNSLGINIKWSEVPTRRNLHRVS